MPAVSAGLLIYRRRPAGLEVLLVHPGGPYWAKKDAGAWSIPKGEAEPGELGEARPVPERDVAWRRPAPAKPRLRAAATDLLVVARRETREETGLEPPGRPSRRWAASRPVTTSSSTPGRSSSTATPRRSSATSSRWSGRRARDGRRGSPRSTALLGSTSDGTREDRPRAAPLPRRPHGRRRRRVKRSVYRSTPLARWGILPRL